MAYGVVYPMIVACLHGVGQNRESDEEHVEDFIEEEFQLARLTFEGRQASSRDGILYYQYLRWIKAVINMIKEKEFIY